MRCRAGGGEDREEGRDRDRSGSVKHRGREGERERGREGGGPTQNSYRNAKEKKSNKSEN